MKRYFFFLFFLLILLVIVPALPLLAENSCEDCHKGEGKQHSTSKFAFELGHSVHGQEDITCQSCHGDDPVIEAYGKTKSKPGTVPVDEGLGAPRTVNVIMSCGQCHEDFRHNFAAGPHREIALLDCASCHDKHAVRKANLDMINPTLCNNQCHYFKHSDEFIHSIRRSLLSADHALKNIESTRRRLIQLGYPAIRLQRIYSNAKHEYRQLTRVFHSFELKRIKQQILLLASLDSQFTDNANIIEAAIHSRKSQKIYIFILGIVLIACALALMAAKQRT